MACWSGDGRSAGRHPGDRRDRTPAVKEGGRWRGGAGCDRPSGQHGLRRRVYVARRTASQSPRPTCGRGSPRSWSQPCLRHHAGLTMKTEFADHRRWRPAGRPKCAESRASRARRARRGRQVAMAAESARSRGSSRASPWRRLLLFPKLRVAYFAAGLAGTGRERRASAVLPLSGQPISIHPRRFPPAPEQGASVMDE